MKNESTALSTLVLACGEEASPAKPLALVRDRPLHESAGRARLFAGTHGLSHRESEVLSMLVNGVHPKAIGDAIGCQYSSVRTHLRRTYKKVGCSGARELVIRYFSQLSSE